MHDKHNLATPSPVTDGTMVYAWFGTGQIVALDRSGAVVWQRHLATENGAFDIQWGHGSSPVLHGDQLILLCDQPARSYLLAIDKKTGKDRWKADRGQGRSSYSTPLVVDGAFGSEVIVNSTERIDAYDAKTGEFLWHTGEVSRFAVPTPVFHNGVIYASRGYRSGPYMAIRPGGRGDVSSKSIVWRIATGAPYCSSLLYFDGVVYMANDVGVLTAVDATSGERIWQERVDGVFSASPVAGGGHIYFVSENGETVVLKAGRAPQVVARNALGERAVASPAISRVRFSSEPTITSSRSGDSAEAQATRPSSQEASAARRESPSFAELAIASRSRENGEPPSLSMTTEIRSSKSVAAAAPSSDARCA